MFYTRAQMIMLTIITRKDQVDFSNSSFHQEKNASTNTDKNIENTDTNDDEARNESENVVICGVQSNRSDNENASQKEPVESQEEKVVSTNINRDSNAR